MMAHSKLPVTVGAPVTVKPLACQHSAFISETDGTVLSVFSACISF